MRKQASQIKPYKIEHKFTQFTLTMTPDNNLLYFDTDRNMLCLWSMEGQRNVLEEQVQGTITKVFSSKGNKRYLVGYESGTLELRSSINLEIEASYSLSSSITDIQSDDESFIVVANSSNELVHYNLKTENGIQDAPFVNL